MDWTAYFENMKDWKRLPAYKAEPRLDSLVGFHLPNLLGEILGERMTGIVPEFPLHIATLHPERGTNRSWKVDFLLVGEHRNWLVEFKTDSGSRRDGQDLYLELAHKAGTGALLEGLRQIVKVSQSRGKYAHLMAKLRLLGLLDDHNAWTGRNPQLEVVYVQPHRTGATATERVVDFGELADWLERIHGGEEFEWALAKALRGWMGD